MKMLKACNNYFDEKDTRQAATGYHQFWPYGRGIFQSTDCTFRIWVNETDHLRMMVMMPGADIIAVMNKLKRSVEYVENAVARQHEGDGKSTQAFAFHPVLGMVSCCPTNLGTGCRASVHINLPLLINKIGLDGIDRVCMEYHCQARGSDGIFSDITKAAIVDISNRYRLGYTEVELVDHMIAAVNALAGMEEAEAESTCTQS